MTTVELLRRARELYEANPCHAPLYKGCSYPTVCPVLALEDAYRESRRRARAGLRGPTRRGAFDDALRVLCTGAGLVAAEAEMIRRQVIEWNAASSTEDVLAAFDAAIATGE